MKAIVLGGPGGAQAKEMELEDLIQMLLGGGKKLPEGSKADHFLVYDDLGADKPMYHRIRTMEERKKADGTMRAPSTLTPLITEATPLHKVECEYAIEHITADGPCTCDDPNCFGRFVKIRMMEMPEGWAATDPIIIPDGASIQ